MHCDPRVERLEPWHACIARLGFRYAEYAARRSIWPALLQTSNGMNICANGALIACGRCRITPDPNKFKYSCCQWIFSPFVVFLLAGLIAIRCWYTENWNYEGARWLDNFSRAKYLEKVSNCRDFGGVVGINR